MTSGKPQAREVELKFELPLADARKVRKHPALAGIAGRKIEQLNIYFDTPKRRLNRNGFSLRVREAGGKRVQTVKAGGETAGLFDRPEWEARVAGLEPDRAALRGTPVAAIKRLASLEEVALSKVKRTIWMVERDGSTIELALDEAAIEGGGNKAAIAELELELKRGAVESLFDLARQLGQSLELRIAASSKSERGYDLAAGTFGQVRKARSLTLDPAMNVGDAFARIILDCVRHFRLNEDRVVAERDPAALHQARVAMRRLRAGLALFGPAIRDSEFPRLRDEIRWLTGSLGDARNLDVFAKSHCAELGASERRKVERARKLAYSAAIAGLRSKRLRDLMLDIVEWLEVGSWRSGRNAERPVAAFAERRLDRQWARVREGGTGLRALDEDRLHRLRIEVKKMRYAVEFLGSLYRRSPVRTFIAALEAIQEALGELNDEVTGRELAARLAVQLPAGGTAGAGARKAQLASVARHFARLERSGLFWKAAAN